MAINSESCSVAVVYRVTAIYRAVIYRLIVFVFASNYRLLIRGHALLSSKRKR